MAQAHEKDVAEFLTRRHGDAEISAEKTKRKIEALWPRREVFETGGPGRR